MAGPNPDGTIDVDLIYPQLGRLTLDKSEIIFGLGHYDTTALTAVYSAADTTSDEQQLPQSWVSAGCCADCSNSWQCPQCLYTNKHSSPYCVQCDDGSTTGLTKPLRLDDDQLFTTLPYLDRALKIIEEKFKHISKKERPARPDFLSNSGSSVEELQAKIEMRRQAKEDDDDAKDRNFDPNEPQSEDEEDDDDLSKSDIICKGGGLDVSDDEDEEGDNSDYSSVDVDLSELDGGAIDYLLNDRRGVDSRRKRAEEYVEVLIKNIENDDTRLLKIPKSMLIEMLKDRCALCGCNPIPGVDPVNSTSRPIGSSFHRLMVCDF